MKKVFYLILLLALCQVGQVNAQSFQKTSSGVKASVNGTDVEIQFYNPSTVRIVKAPTGWNYEKESLSVIEKPQAVKLSVTQSGQVVRVKSQTISVAFNLTSGEISFSDAKGKALLNEKGAPTFTNFNDAGVKTFSVAQAFQLDTDEAIYGLGQLQNGKMSQRGITKRLIQGNVEDVVTFFQSVKGYGLFWDNYSPTVFADKPEGTSFTSEVGDLVDYYFMYGGNADGVVAQMRALTGDVPMFPLWTYGFFQSKERYKSQNETVGVVRRYRELGVPLDGIIQDWQYWGSNYLWNAMEFLNEEFPNPKKMMSDIHGMNAKMVISIWSSFGPQTKQYRAMAPKNMLLDMGTWPQSGLSSWPPNREYPSSVKPYDAYHPEARDIYWDHLNKGLFSLGMDGWWMDSTEPDHLDAKPEDMDNQTYLGSFRKVRNAYPLMAVGGVYDHQRATSSDKRVFILTRSAFAGQQRYGANTWTGDVQATWKDLAHQVTAGLNFSLCGIPHWNSDIGGFFLGSYPRKLQDPGYHELFVRWMQFGTFNPMMRSHGADAPREIWQFGQKGERIYDAIEKYINLRYSLLPYIYSMSWDVTANRSSMMRALMMDFKDDKKAWDINDQFMFGKSLLVCPVVNPMYTQETGSGRNLVRTTDYSNAKSRSIYLPEGTQWYDFWTNEKLQGGQTIEREAPIEIIPLYVKAGTILPIGPQVQYATEKAWDMLELKVYAGANGSFVLYEDEFDNYNYEQGAYTEIPITWDNASRKLTIGARKGAYEGMLKTRIFTVTLQDGTKKAVNYAGKKVVVTF
ncbi:alpha-D-xyloside xylohydrolase [Parabacteroides sp. PFB2-12]|uniref:glycoside hydrolase family 31 protein n=1 Tax=unclassified Parabacteroides TaxID=2649774 RepID=UPI00247670D6|nr:MULTISPECIES: glycoside hydrolase family 31 protein [unclassified Parabacteroides]MDH6342485.1 alpha-D-xyloside xylohydrolase [Parabacteroides sp. PM6-13]MDH6390137.1 alpha-D-xyloside xylohydrolase [Parabacteroides sp. PFB2-12]